VTKALAFVKRKRGLGKEHSRGEIEGKKRVKERLKVKTCEHTTIRRRGTRESREREIDQKKKRTRRGRKDQREEREKGRERWRELAYI